MWIPRHGRRNRSRKAKCAYEIGCCRNLSAQLGVHLLFGVALLEFGAWTGTLPWARRGRESPRDQWPFSITTANPKPKFLKKSS